MLSGKGERLPHDVTSELGDGTPQDAGFPPPAYLSRPLL